MKIYIANQSKQKIGGGWSFIYYFSTYAKDYLSDYENSDIYFISGATMVQREDVFKAKECGKRIILRIDNIPKNSRNRNSGTGRLYDIAQMADLVIYQSQWAQDYVGYFTHKNGPVIYNGVDINIFKPIGPKWPSKAKKVYLYSRYNRDESKRLEEAFYYYHMVWRKEKDSELWIMGQFSPEIVSSNFDFFMNEPIKWLGCITELEQIAMFYRGADVLLYPYFNDACSNTLIEAICCGMEIETCLSGNTGGSKEILKLGKDYDWSAQRMVNEYIDQFKKIL